MKNLKLFSISLVLLAACQDQPTNPPAAPSPARAAAAPSITGQDTSSYIIPGEYIVRFRDDVADPRGVAAGLARVQGFSLRHHFDSPRVKGFLAAGVSPTMLEVLHRNPLVAYVEPNKRAVLATFQSSPGWGLDRVDQYSTTLDSRYYYENTGSGVRLYVIDTGILYNHSEFGGRAVPGYDHYGSGGSDCMGHGTGVAGAAGGATTGTAKGVTLVSVRAGDCYDTYLAGLIGGAQWVTADHAAGVAAVANMSSRIPGGSQTLDDAVQEAINDGVVFVVAAGNDNQNACSHSPVRLAAAITVGATSSNDARAAFSNYGSCLDLFAPGDDVYTPWTSPSYVTVDGTSFSSPYVAGVAALYLYNHPSATPQQVRDVIVNQAAAVVTNAGTGSTTKLLQSVLGSITIAGPDVIPCGQSATYTIVSQDAPTPHEYRWYYGPNPNMIMLQAQTRTITAGNTTSTVGLIASFRDERNVFYWNANTPRYITLCP
jgi:subtilisin family serine protease